MCKHDPYLILVSVLYIKFIHTSYFDSSDKADIFLCLFFLLRAPQAMMDLLVRQERGLVSDIF